MKKIVTAALVLLVVWLSGCTNSSRQEEAHAHEDVKNQITAYGKDFEVFAEADPFVVGNAGAILAHFSYLSDFKPLLKGKVTVSLIVGSKGIRQTLEKPERPGIYRFSLKPEVAGKGRLLFEIESTSGKSTIIADSITVYTDEHDAIHDAEKGAKGGANTVVFTKEQSWKIDFRTELPVIQPFGQVIKTTAQVLSAQGDEAIITAKTNGVVEFGTASNVEGNAVARGQRMFTISGSGMSDNNLTVRYAEASNNFERTKADYMRLKDLSKDKIVAEKDVLRAKNEYENAKAQYENYRRNFSLNGQTGTSPIGGYVKQLFVRNGQYVESGQPIVSVSQNKTLLLRADVQQKYASILGMAKSANIRTIENDRTYTLEALNGKVLSYGRSLNTDNYLIPVTLQIDNKGDFTSGEFVEVYLKMVTSAKALVVPKSALLEDQGNFFVFVQVHPELFEKREVKVGAADGLNVEIKAGLRDTDRIVTKGAVLVKLAQASGALDAHSGHVH